MLAPWFLSAPPPNPQVSPLHKPPSHSQITLPSRPCLLSLASLGSWILSFLSVAFTPLLFLSCLPNPHPTFSPLMAWFSPLAMFCLLSLLLWTLLTVPSFISTVNTSSSITLGAVLCSLYAPHIPGVFTSLSFGSLRFF